MCYLTDHNVHLAFVQETWLRKSDGHLLTKIKEYGYKILQYRKQRKLDFGGGVMLIYKDNINVRNTKTVHYKSFEHIKCKVITDKGPITFVNVYRPEYSSKNRFTINKFMSEFSSFMKDITEESSSPCFVLGDFNIHVELIQNSSCANEILSVSRNTKRSHADKFLKLLEEVNFGQFVDTPTHELQGTLDLLITQTLNKDMVKGLYIGYKNEICESDHFLVSFSLDESPALQDGFIDISKRDFKNFDRELFCRDLNNAHLLDAFKQISLDDCVLLYNYTLSSILDKQCPVMNMRVKLRPRQKWFNSDLRNMKRQKRSIERQWKKYKTSSLEHELNAIKTLYKNACNDARDASLKLNFDRVKSNSKALHKYVNYVTGDEKSRVLPSCTDKFDLANKMTSFYDNKIKNIRQEISELPGETFSPLMQPEPVNCEMLNFSQMNSSSLRKTLTDINSKGHPHDPVPVWIVKDCINDMLPILLYIVNKSLTETFPQPLKHAVVCPIIKDRDEDSELFANYRPVSNLPFLSKVIERCASLQINNYLCKNNLYPSCQSAYRKSHSCETALLKIVSDIQKEVHQRNMVALIALDLSSAFDTIDHDLLLKKLKSDFGLSGRVILWLKSYLTGRTFAVRIGNIDGRAVILIYGVPQGSILGPLLFILYVHDLGEVIKHFGLQAHFYADDSELYIGFSPLSQMSSTAVTIKRCFVEVKKWMQINFLKLNADKTKVTFFGRSADFNLFDVQFTLDDELYKSNENMSIKTLGVHLDGKISMQKMVTECVKCCYLNLKKLQSLRHNIDKETKITLVNSHILSRLDYCNILLCGANKTQITKLQRVLNAGVRFIFNLKKTHSVTEYTKDVHFLPVQFRIMYKSCVTVYKIMYDMAPEYLNSMVSYAIPSRPNLRSMDDILTLKLPGCDKGIHFNMIQNWNSLPFELRHEPSFETFKNKLKTFYFRVAYNT